MENQSTNCHPQHLDLKNSASDLLPHMSLIVKNDSRGTCDFVNFENFLTEKESNF